MATTRDFRRGNKLSLALLGLGKIGEGFFKGKKEGAEIEQMLAERALKQDANKLAKQELALKALGMTQPTTSQQFNKSTGQFEAVTLPGVSKEFASPFLQQAGLTEPESLGSKQGKIMISPSEWNVNPSLRADMFAFQKLLEKGVKNSLNADEADALSNLRIKLDVPIHIKRVEDLKSWVKDKTGYDLGVEYNVSGGENLSSNSQTKSKQTKVKKNRFTVVAVE